MPSSDHEARVLAQLEGEFVGDPDFAHLWDLFPHPSSCGPPCSRFPTSSSRVVRWLNTPGPAPASLGWTLVLETAAAINCDLFARTGSIALLVAALCLMPVGLLPLAAYARREITT